MAKQRRQRLGYGAREYPAEFGLHLVVTKTEILGPERAAELKRRGWLTRRGCWRATGIRKPLSLGLRRRRHGRRAD